MSDPLVQREDQGPIVVLTLNRPDARNALSRDLVATLSDLMDVIAAEPGPRVVILTGAGPAFCAGMDLKEVAVTDASSETEGRAVEDTQAIAHLINQIHCFPRPMIAVVQGAALGGGAGLALACDLVVIEEAARIGYPEVRRGLVPAIVLHDLARQVGDRRARELALTGEPLDAETAGRWGLVNRVVPDGRGRDEALALARTLLESAPIAIATTKRLLDEASHRPTNLRGAAAVSAAVRVGDEAAEGVQAFLEKRATHWHIDLDHIPSYDDRDDGIDPDLPTGPGPN